MIAILGETHLSKKVQTLVSDSIILNDIDEVIKLRPSLAIVQWRNHLMQGFVDRLQKAGIRTFGCTKDMYRIESSKIFAKEFCRKHDIPTSQYFVYDRQDLSLLKYPLVVKNDADFPHISLRCYNAPEAQAVVDVITGRGCKAVIEEYLKGIEVHLTVFTDGKSYHICPATDDIKTIGNSGGVASKCPVAGFDEQEVRSKIIEPTLQNYMFRGALQFCFMQTESGPKLFEYNARMCTMGGILIIDKLKTSLLDIFSACADGTLHELNIAYDNRKLQLMKNSTIMEVG